MVNLKETGGYLEDHPESEYGMVNWKGTEKTITRLMIFFRHLPGWSSKYKYTKPGQMLLDRVGLVQL